MKYVILSKAVLIPAASVVAIGTVGIVVVFSLKNAPEDSAGHAHAPDAGAHTHGEQIAGGQNSAYPVVTVVQPVLATDSGETIEAAGQVLAAQHAEIYPRREGVVQSLSVNLGDTVRKGQAVASLQADRDQSQLSADLAYKKKELEIAKQRLSVSSETNKTIAEVSLEAGQKDKAARLQKIDAEILAMEISAKQAEVSVENAAYDLIDAATIMMYTRTDAISRFDDYNPYDHYRRREIFYPKDDEAKAVEQKLLALYRSLKKNAYKEDVLGLIAVAMNTASTVRGISANASNSADYSDENTNQRGEINAVVDHLAELSGELVTSASRRSVLEAEKQSIQAGATQSLLAIETSGKNSQLDISLLEAEIERIASQMGASRTVYAPFDGVITKRHVNVGDSVNLDKPLFTLVDNKHMFVRFNISETDLPFVQKNTKITFAPTSAPSHMHKAVISRIAQAIDPVSRTILVEADLDPKDRDGHALSQMTVRAHIPLSHGTSLFAVPQKALELSKKSDGVWIVNEQVEAERLSVKVQYVHKGVAYIAEGVTGAEWIIISSPVELKEGLEIDTTTAL